MYDYIMKLEFSEDPDYDYMLGLFSADEIYTRVLGDGRMPELKNYCLVNCLNANLFNYGLYG